MTEYVRVRGQHGKGEGSAQEALKTRQGSLEAKIILRAEELRRVNDRLSRSETLLRMASRAARFGGWSVDLLERFTRMPESIADAFCSVDRDWRFSFVNREFGRIFGVKQEDLLGRNCWQVFPDALGTRFEEEYGRAMEERVPITFVEF